MKCETIRAMTWLGLGACAGIALHALWTGERHSAFAQAAQPSAESETLAAELAAIKGKLPDQAHAMQDVGYHFSNLWFAGQHAHWELANFYWSEVRSHLRWAARIIPLRKDNAGRDVDVQLLLQGFENAPLAELQQAIAAHDKRAFETAYRRTIEGCYGCHKAADKPFIRPQIPTQPETPIVNFDPSADWPR